MAFTGEDSCERLREAACVGDLNLLSKLVETQGVNLNSKNGMNGWTALHWACKRNHVTVVSYLLGNGADKNIVNSDGLIPAQLTSNEEIKRLLGASEIPEVKSNPLPITPNYLANPPFPYANDKEGENSKHEATSNLQARFSGGDVINGNTSAVPNNLHVHSQDELVLKARLANSDEKDFIEIELSRSSLSFSKLLNLMCTELGVNKDLVAKVRKLPDTIIRKDKDVGRLHDFQELELVLTNKAMSAASRTYSIGPAKNHETILY